MLHASRTPAAARTSGMPPFGTGGQKKTPDITTGVFSLANRMQR